MTEKLKRQPAQPAKLPSDMRGAVKLGFGIAIGFALVSLICAVIAAAVLAYGEYFFRIYNA